MSHRVVITGMGCVSPFGAGIESFWQGLTRLQSALRFNDNFDALVGEVPAKSEGFPRGLDILAHLPSHQLREMSRASVLGLIAAEEAFNDSKFVIPDEGDEEMGVNIGSGISDLIEIHETGKKIDEGRERTCSPYFVPKILTNIPASYVSSKYKLLGGNASASTACATGATCIGDAFLYVKSGRWKRALAGATESCVNKISLVGFRRLRALANGAESNISRPFDKTRSGFVLSEGAAIVFLERLEDALERKARIYAEVLGYGLATDAYHLTSPSPNGLGSTLCIKRSIRDAQIEPDQVGYVNAHATSTPLGDKAEALSIAETIPNAAVSSIKGNIGHCLAAAGSLEVAATALSVQNGLIVPNLNFNEPDAGVELDLIKGATREWKDEKQRRIAVCNSFGFGGAYVSLVLAQIER